MNSEADWAKGAQQFQQLFGDSWSKALQSFQGLDLGAVAGGAAVTVAATVSPVRSAQADCPESRPPVGTTPTEVRPPARETGVTVDCGLKPSIAR